MKLEFKQEPDGPIQFYAETECRGQREDRYCAMIIPNTSPSVAELQTYFNVLLQHYERLSEYELTGTITERPQNATQ